MEKWRIAVISSLGTIVIILIIMFIMAVIQTGVAETIKEEVIDDYCSSIPITEARDLEVCK